MTLFINIVSNNESLISTPTNNAFRCKASWKHRHTQTHTHTHTYLKISPGSWTILFYGKWLQINLRWKDISSPLLLWRCVC